MRSASVFSAASMKMQLEGQAAALLEHGAAQRTFAVRVVFHLGRLEDFSESDAHALGNGGDVAHD